ncbi:uncharacterized protein LOC124938916 [Impatiens glandulifera]|uniref:uncharacterized protein LOC124938916 n=1 Tax=Impatiens glandulifera TaxID=253017 RepID=UPI001FB15778|nr:uncharacterized protein LOC124938916 [Impatiens glandulifera]
MSRDDIEKIEKYFDDLEKINLEFESIERPWLEIETYLQKPELESKMELEVTLTATDKPRLSGSQLLANSPTSKTIMLTSVEDHNNFESMSSPTAESTSIEKLKINVGFQKEDDTLMQSQSPVGVLSPGSKLEVLEVIEKAMNEKFSTILEELEKPMKLSSLAHSSSPPAEFSNNANTNNNNLVPVEFSNNANTNNNNLVKELDDVSFFGT